MIEYQEELITTTELLKILKISKITLYDWIKKGKVRYIRIGKEYRFDRKELDRLLKGE